MKKLVHSNYGICLELEENKVNEIVVENPVMLTQIVRELGEQCEGNEGGFVLSEENRILPVEKFLILIKDLFSLDCNNRKILTRLYQKIGKTMDQISEEERRLFYRGYIGYMESICEKSSLYLLYDEEPGIQEVLKMAGLRLDVQTDTMLECIVEYLKIVHELLGQTVFVFLNLKLFLTKEELKRLYQECFYRKIQLILIEAVYQEKSEEENVCVIDKDRCIIYL